MRIGVFGGTFDPIHYGHLLLAEQCREQGRLDQVLFIPAARPPHKREQPLTPFAQRVEMLSLAIAGHPAFRIDDLEKDRPGPSFTVETLEELRQNHPGDDLFLLIGSDSLQDFPTWYQPARIIELAHLLVVSREDNFVVPLDDLRQALQLATDAPLRVHLVHMPLIGIASRDLRRRVTAGRSLRYFVPRAVEAYIVEKKLYKVSQ